MIYFLWFMWGVLSAGALIRYALKKIGLFEEFKRKLKEWSKNDT